MIETSVCLNCQKALPKQIPSEWEICPYCAYELKQKKSQIVKIEVAEQKINFQMDEAIIGDMENECIYCSSSSKLFNLKWKYCPVCGKSATRIALPSYAKKRNGKWDKCEKPTFSQGNEEFAIMIKSLSGACIMNCDISQTKNIRFNKGSKKREAKSLNDKMPAIIEFISSGIPEGMIIFEFNTGRDDALTRNSKIQFSFQL